MQAKICKAKPELKWLKVTRPKSEFIRPFTMLYYIRFQTQSCTSGFCYFLTSYGSAFIVLLLFRFYAIKGEKKILD